MNAKTTPWLLCLSLLLIQSLSSSSIPAQTAVPNQTTTHEMAPQMAPEAVPETAPETPSQMTPEMRAAVEMDWDREAQRLGRDLSSFEEIASLFTRAQQTVDSWKTLPDAWPRQDVTAELARLETLKRKFDSMRQAPETTAEQRLALYREVRDFAANGIPEEKRRYAEKMQQLKPYMQAWCTPMQDWERDPYYLLNSRS